MREFTNEEKEALIYLASNPTAEVDFYDNVDGKTFRSTVRRIDYCGTELPFCGTHGGHWFAHIRLPKKHPMSDERIDDWCMNTPRGFVCEHDRAPMLASWLEFWRWKMRGEKVEDFIKKYRYRGTVNEDDSFSALETWEE